MPLVEFVGQSVQDSGNVAVNPARLINCYRERVLGQGKTTHVLQSVLGQAQVDDIGANAIQGAGQGNDLNWLAGGGSLFEVADNGTVTNRGAIASDANTTIAGNYSDVTIVAGGNYYVWDGSQITEPTTKTFPTVGSHCYVGGYTVLTEKDGKRFQWSDLGNAQSLDALNFSSADKMDDNLIRGVEIRGNLVLFGERSMEMWQVTGLANTEAFAYVTSWNRGLKSFNLLARFDDTLFFVGNDNNVYIGVGDGAVDITTPAVNTALTDNNATHCFFYEDRGHKFCVVRFSDRPAWVFDVKMQEWHERGEGAGHQRWRATHSIRGNTWQIGNTDGEVYSLSRTNKDLNGPLHRKAVSSPVYTGSKFRVGKLEVNCRVGEEMLNEAVDSGLDASDGFILDAGEGFGLLADSLDGTERAAMIKLCETRDGGRTWSARKPRSLGMKGDYDQRTIWRARGQAQQYAVCLEVNEPIDIQVNTTVVVEVL